MKKLLVICVLCSPMFAYAAENCSTTTGSETVEEQLEIKTDVPKHLVGATVCVRQADGKESCVPAEKFKVVPRKQQFIVSKTKQLDKMSCSTEVLVAAEAKKNRVSLMAGNGPKEGLDRSSDGSTVTVESKVGAVGGAQYQRLLNERVSVGTQVQTNKSVLFNVGVDF